MASVFLSKVGVVNVVGGDDGEALPGRVELDGLVSTAVIIVDANYTQATNQQFQSSLEDTIYMYVFGDQMGKVEITGLIFGAGCLGGATSGVEDVLNYYKDNRASKKETAVIVQVGETKISGFLTAMMIRSENPEDRINRFAFTISSLPDSDGTDAPAA